MASCRTFLRGVDTIRAGRQQIGLWLALANSYSVEICAGSGFDWLLFDGEHGPNDPPAMLPQLQAAAAYPVSCIVRPAWNDPVLLKRLLDIGTQAVLVPFVQNAEEAAKAVSACRYPPAGIRGITVSGRGSRYAAVFDAILDAAGESGVDFGKAPAPEPESTTDDDWAEAPAFGPPAAGRPGQRPAVAVMQFMPRNSK